MTTSMLQIGKNGLTENFIETIRDRFKKYNNIKISILKSAGHEREKVKEFSERILDALGKNYTAKAVGFTIFLKKWRKKVR